MKFCFLNFRIISSEIKVNSSRIKSNQTCSLKFIIIIFWMKFYRTGQSWGLLLLLCMLLNVGWWCSMHLLHLFQDPSGVCDILAGMAGYRATSNKSRVHTIFEVFCDIWISKADEHYCKYLNAIVIFSSILLCKVVRI